MQDSTDRNLLIQSFRSESLAKNKRIERVCYIRKKEIELAIVEIDKRLKELTLAKNVRKKTIMQEVPKIRNMIFELYNLWVYQLDVRSFAGCEHGVDEKTPLNPCMECAT